MFLAGSAESIYQRKKIYSLTIISANFEYNEIAMCSYASMCVYPRS